MDLDLLKTLLVSRFEDRIIPPVGAFPEPRIAMFAAVSCVLGRLRLYRKFPAPSPMVKVSVLEMIPLLWTMQPDIKLLVEKGAIESLPRSSKLFIKLYFFKLMRSPSHSSSYLPPYVVSLLLYAVVGNTCSRTKVRLVMAGIF